MRQWRLIVDSPAVGPRNMAVDDAILAAVATASAPPTLRLYAWSIPCLSLGYAQKARDVDFERLAGFGWDVVRRPTGGRAILHSDELTYSLALPLEDPVAAGSVIESYRRISGALRAGVERLGIIPQAGRHETAALSSPAVCFERTSHYEITVDGRKLIGSAQLRRKAGLLQHGSLPLDGDISRICDALAYPDAARRGAAQAAVRARAATLFDVTGRQIPWPTAADALVAGFTAAFAVEFIRGTLTSEEARFAQRRCHDTYARSEWTRRR